MKPFVIFLKRKLEEMLLDQRYFWSGRRKPKIFVIGLNKTGTTSVHRALRREGIKLGDQLVGERLLSAYMKSDFAPILRYCKSARAFQDVPFSFPDTYRHLYEAFSDAKFILTIRDSGEQWVDSHVNFVVKRLGKVPTLEDMKEATYCWKGWMYDVHRTVYGEGVRFDDRQVKMECYHRHKRDVQEFFRDKPDRLLVLNLAQDRAFASFCEFLGIRSAHADFPWANKTGEVKV